MTDLERKAMPEGSVVVCGECKGRVKVTLDSVFCLHCTAHVKVIVIVCKNRQCGRVYVEHW